MDALHRGEEVGHQLGVVAGEDLVSDGDAVDFGGGDVGFDVLLDPGLGLGRVGHFLEVLVSQPDYEFDIGVGEC